MSNTQPHTHQVHIHHFEHTHWLVEYGDQEGYLNLMWPRNPFWPQRRLRRLIRKLVAKHDRDSRRHGEALAQAEQIVVSEGLEVQPDPFAPQRGLLRR